MVAPRSRSRLAISSIDMVNALRLRWGARGAGSRLGPGREPLGVSVGVLVADPLLQLVDVLAAAEACIVLLDLDLAGAGEDGVVDPLVLLREPAVGQHATAHVLDHQLGLV